MEQGSRPVRAQSKDMLFRKIPRYLKDSAPYGKEIILIPDPRSLRIEA